MEEESAIPKVWDWMVLKPEMMAQSDQGAFLDWAHADSLYDGQVCYAALGFEISEAK